VTELIPGLIAAYVIVGAVLNRVWLWLSPPPAALYPREGAVIRSDAEGLAQRILRIDGDWMWSSVTLDPGAPGPRMHVHDRFAERFHVKSGRVQLDLPDGAKLLTAGEEHLVSPGTPHRFSNPTSDPAVVEGPLTMAYALPRRFGLFLQQAYGYFDEAPATPMRALFQMSFWSPEYDVWMPGPPIVAQRLVFALVRPVAALLGYRPWYARFD
jgi:mannose-6-phosphate isomerase-like protein (cupin superfamily)